MSNQKKNYKNKKASVMMSKIRQGSFFLNHYDYIYLIIYFHTFYHIKTCYTVLSVYPNKDRFLFFSYDHDYKIANNPVLL